ncbi:MAG TPA: glycosyltransferase family 4 protein [Vicinamibacterales bacterium]|nr:glycosyltransferase family 4 protein [Vicinamibacterales bacterium]
MSTPLRILIATDSFPPVCGGSGWSTWELTRGLIKRGHHVEVVKVDAGGRRGVFQTHYDGIPVAEFCRPATKVPVVRNLQKNERLWPALEKYLHQRLRDGAFDLVHGQHAMTTVPSINAAAAAGVPAVATVRDYWPVCYWSDLIYDPQQSQLCPECTASMMTKCIRPRARAATPAAWTLIPYMRLNLQTKRRTIARAGAIIAPSHAITRDLRERAPEIAETPIYTIPNPVDMVPLDEIHATAKRPKDQPYLLYAGKLAPNKGVQFLLGAYAAAGVTWPLVVAGDGPMRAQLEAEARQRGIPMEVLGWISRNETLAWMRHAEVLAFPSYGPESLSRVLIEASALGVPIAAMDTGGTRDIIHHGLTGLLSKDPQGFAADLRTLANDDRLRAALGSQARIEAKSAFSAASVVERIEQVYRSLLEPRAA